MTDIYSEDYIAFFEDENGAKYGARLATVKDTINLSTVYKDVYGWEYVYPYVYNEILLEKEIEKESKLWFLAEDMQNNEVVAAGSIDIINNEFLFGGKVIGKKRIQGLGIVNNLGIAVVPIMLADPHFSNFIRIDNDVRAINIKPQRFVESVGCVSYGMVPNYYNFGDKRNFDSSVKRTFSEGRTEPYMMYVLILQGFWKKRSRNISLLDHEDIHFFYKLLSDKIPNMKDDNLNFVKKSDLEVDNYKIDEDVYNSCVAIKGTVTEKTLRELLHMYRNWNCINWRIPSIPEGIRSMDLAQNNNFLVAGYDPASIRNKEYHDSVLFCAFPNGVNNDQFDLMDLTEENRPIADHVIKTLKNLN